MEEEQHDNQQPKNGYVLDPESPTELARLVILDRAITQSMGGPLAGVPFDLSMHHVLDLACGPGSWVLDVAYAHPSVEVAGVDISEGMISYAAARARSQQRTNASFGVMDITMPLDFADGTFDVMNARFLVGVLHGEEQWRALLSECVRLLRPGGILRLAESDGLAISTSPSLSRLQQGLLAGMQRLGYGFALPGEQTLAITPVLPWLLSQTGMRPQGLLPWVLDFSFASRSWQAGVDLCQVTYELALEHGLLDALVESGQDIRQLLRSMQIEMHQQSFCALTYGALVCGEKPPR